nr:14421_t:CDS:2 [Entrophospora candida]
MKFLNHHNDPKTFLESLGIDHAKSYFNGYIGVKKTKIYNFMSTISYMFKKELKPYLNMKHREVMMLSVIHLSCYALLGILQCMPLISMLKIRVEKVNKLLISNKETHKEWKHWLDITPDEGYNLILEPLLE